MKAKLVRVLRFLAYPALYLACLLAFIYLCLPTATLKGRIEAEFAQRERRARGPGEATMELSIGELDTYWLTGLELEDIALTVPARAAKGGSALAAIAGDAPAGDSARPSVLKVDRVTARVRILPLFIGKLTIDFTVEAFGGTIEGHAPLGGAGDLEVELSGIQLDRIEPLKAMLEGLPLFGVVHGSLSLSPEDGSFAKATGKLEVAADDVVLGDGKAKLIGVALPAAKVGHVSIVAKAEKGQLTIEELSAHGRDFELSGTGKLRLQESWKRTTSDVFVELKFTDSYRDLDDATRGLLGKPGQKYKPAIELDPRGTFKKAKSEDDFYRFHVTGRLDRLDVQPAGALSGKKRGAMKSEKVGDGPLGGLGREKKDTPAPNMPREPRDAPRRGEERIDAARPPVTEKPSPSETAAPVPEAPEHREERAPSEPPPSEPAPDTANGSDDKGAPAPGGDG